MHRAASIKLCVSVQNMLEEQEVHELPLLRIVFNRDSSGDEGDSVHLMPYVKVVYIYIHKCIKETTSCFVLWLHAL